MTIQFKVTYKDKKSKARIGQLKTPHGLVETPVFMPVATKAAVKTLLPEEVKNIGYCMILSNTYHLFLQPGQKIIEKMGGLHKFMNWDGPILTDSGGYQVFSLSKIFDISDDGISFASHIDGSRHFLAPEDVVDIQLSLGSDIAMILDECPPYEADEDYVKLSMIRTLNWSKRSIKHISGSKNETRKTALFGIVQGGMFPDLRQASADKTVEIGFSGYGIGGLSVGEPQSEMFEVLDKTLQHLPEDKPRYLMGVGDPQGIAEAIKMGVDMFDSALPTRIARNGTAFLNNGRLNILNAELRDDARPIEEGCQCYTCQNFSRSYIRHLYQTKETLALRLLTWHNLYFVYWLIEKIKKEVRVS